MKLRPIKRYIEPGFPTRVILDTHPELLRVLPRRWHGNTVVLTALATACLISAARWHVAHAQGKDQPASRVAPIFQHGDGRGAFGCDAVNPPVFLSEDEARQVILEEAKRAGITFELDKVTLPNIDVPVTVQHHEEKIKTQTLPLALDGTETKRQISFEYVSETDFKAWEDTKNSIMSTVQTYDMLTTAKTLRASLATAKPAGTTAVFYDPIIGCHAALKDAEANGKKIEWKDAPAAARALAKEELCKQVKDYIAWLKAQGVI